MNHVKAVPKAEAFKPPHCPVCSSIQRYFRIRKRDFVCRSCGTSYDYKGTVLQKSIPGKVLTHYVVAVVGKPRGKNTGK